MPSVTNASALLREGLLEGVAILCAGTPGPLGRETARACEQLGARVIDWQSGIDSGQIDFLCYDGAGTFAAAREGREALETCLERAWEITREVVAAPLLERQQVARAERAEADAPAVPSAQRGHPSRLVYIAPPAGYGAHAEAARAGLENLVRTLSIEWARFAVCAVAIAPGAHTAPADVGAVVAYLCSPAGAYFSGCLLDLSGPAISLRS
jgi:NAD(P)-dependent dehydrogenase (short-subunit alcohol dehydrogenase family)